MDYNKLIFVEHFLSNDHNLNKDSRFTIVEKI